MSIAKILLNYYKLCKNPQGTIMDFITKLNITLCDFFDLINKFKLPYYDENFVLKSKRKKIFKNLPTKTYITLSTDISLIILRKKYLISWCCYNHLIKKVINNSDFIKIYRY